MKVSETNRMERSEMRATATLTPNTVKNYPYIGEFRGSDKHYLVYFFNKNTGVILHVFREPKLKLNHTVTHYDEGYFTLYTGSVTLMND
jgi:hypothetical protein